MDCGLGSIIFLVYGEKTLGFFCDYVFRFSGFKVDTVFYLRFGDIDCFFLFQGFWAKRQVEWVWTADSAKLEY